MSDKVLAVAAGHEITEGELNTLIANYPAEQRMYLTSPQAKAQILDQLIAFHLFGKMAVEEKITETEEFKTTIERMKIELASHMAATKTVEGAVVTEEEEKAFYEENKAQFIRQPQVSAKHILVDTEELANKIAEEIAAGKSFEEAAKEYSTCPSSERGGDLGFFGKGQMVPEFEKAAFAADIETVVGPVQTQFGYHLIWVDAKVAEQAYSYEEVRDQIQQQLLGEKQRAAYDAKVSELAAKYGVEKR